MSSCVLVVDDEPDIRLLFQRALEIESYLVLTAGDGNEALQQFKDNDVDLVLTDIHMPSMHGIELCYHISQEDPHCPIIAISGGGGNADPMLAKQGLDSAEMEGAVAIFYKPVKLEDLLVKVNEILQS